jgi:hypothetical protein
MCQRCSILFRRSVAPRAAVMEGPGIRVGHWIPVAHLGSFRVPGWPAGPVQACVVKFISRLQVPWPP